MMKSKILQQAVGKLTGKPVQDTCLRATPFPRASSELSRSLGKPRFCNSEDEEDSEEWRDPTAAALGWVALLLAGPRYPRGSTHPTGSSGWRTRTSTVLGHWQKQNRQWTCGTVSAAHCLLPNLALLLGARKIGVRPEF